MTLLAVGFLLLVCRCTVTKWLLVPTTMPVAMSSPP